MHLELSEKKLSRHDGKFMKEFHLSTVEMLCSEQRKTFRNENLSGNMLFSLLQSQPKTYRPHSAIKRNKLELL